VIKDQERLIVVQNRVAMRKTLIVAHLVKSFERRNAGFQDAIGHLRFYIAVFSQELDVFAEEAMEALSRVTVMPLCAQSERTYLITKV
jgi:hypothetical protein